MTVTATIDGDVNFGGLAIGQAFLDGASGEFYRKETDNTAVCLSGGDAFEGEQAVFDVADAVEPAEPEEAPAVPLGMGG